MYNMVKSKEEIIKREELIKKGFEMIIKFSKCGKIPFRHVSFSGKGRITFSQDLFNIIKDKFGAFEIYINRKDNLIIFYPSNDANNSFQIHKSSFFSKSLLKDLEKTLQMGYYPARYNMGVIEVDYSKRTKNSNESPYLGVKK